VLFEDYQFQYLLLCNRKLSLLLILRPLAAAAGVNVSMIGIILGGGLA